MLSLLLVNLAHSIEWQSKQQRRGQFPNCSTNCDSIWTCSTLTAGMSKGTDDVAGPSFHPLQHAFQCALGGHEQLTQRLRS